MADFSFETEEQLLSYLKKDGPRSKNRVSLMEHPPGMISELGALTIRRWARDHLTNEEFRFVRCI